MSCTSNYDVTIKDITAEEVKELHDLFKKSRSKIEGSRLGYDKDKTDAVSQVLTKFLVSPEGTTQVTVRLGSSFDIVGGFNDLLKFMIQEEKGNMRLLKLVNSVKVD